jgi:phosphohistidine phosphatase
VVTSPALRTLQTARLVAHELGYPSEFLQREADLYLATPDEILKVIARQDNAFNDILVCGHNPGLTDLVNQLTGARIDNVPTCGLAVIESTIRDWHDLRNGGILVSFDYPKRAEDRESTT